MLHLNIFTCSYFVNIFKTSYSRFSTFYRKMALASSDSVHRPRLFIIALVMVAWISCSLVTQIANKKVLSAELSPMLLIGCQMVFGCVLQVIISAVICLKDSTDRKCFELNPLCFAVGAFNVMVHMLTYYPLYKNNP